MRVISLWSGPRNVSTALMYSFSQRADFDVVDEPLYGHYLSLTHADHPGREEILATMNTNGLVILKDLLQPGSKPYLFLKNMAHHWINLDDRLLTNFSNIFLIRDPLEMLPSLAHQIPKPTLKDTGLKKQWELFEKLEALKEPLAIIDSKQLLLNPQVILEKICAHLRIPFDSSMLSWPPGPILQDGVWSKYWYQNVHKSSGFQPYRTKSEVFPIRLRPLLDECKPFYKLLFDKSIKL
ncbi:MAG: sulfotransferase family protein [Bacteroidota bacterium]